VLMPGVDDEVAATALLPLTLWPRLTCEGKGDKPTESTGRGARSGKPPTAATELGGRA
jgi:hypothetical protein